MWGVLLEANMKDWRARCDEGVSVKGVGRRTSQVPHCDMACVRTKPTPEWPFDTASVLLCRPLTCTCFHTV